MTEIVILIGDLGSGKNTLATALALMMQQERPDVPIFSNTAIKGAHFVEDTNKLIATKLIARDRQYALVITDEASQSGFEARGSGSSKGQAIETRVITLARKANVDEIIISQMLSMIDKRVQWLGTIYVLCEAKRLPGNYTIYPDLFAYTPFDSNMVEIPDAGFELYFDECVEHIFPYMETWDIPNLEQLKQQLTKWFGIEDSDYENFNRIMGTNFKETKKEDTRPTMPWESNKWFPESTLIRPKGEDSEWQVESRIWVDEKEDDEE